MTLQEFKQQREMLNRRLVNTRKQLERLEADFVKSLSVKPGDMICVNGKFIGWLVSISASVYKWDIKYNPPKKDGSQSNRIVSTYCELSDIQLFTN